MRDLVGKFEFFLNIFFLVLCFLSSSELFYVIWGNKNDSLEKIDKNSK